MGATRGPLEGKQIGLRGIGANPRPAQLLRQARLPDVHKPFVCETCASDFISSRIDSKFCSNACDKNITAIGMTQGEVEMAKRKRAAKTKPGGNTDKRQVSTKANGHARSVLENLRVHAAVPVEPPIAVDDEMVTVFIRQRELLPTVIGCLRGRCKAEKPGTKCAECLTFEESVDFMRELTSARIWDHDGIGADQAEPPGYLNLNPQARADWRRHWQLRLDLIAAAQRRGMNA